MKSKRYRKGKYGKHNPVPEEIREKLWNRYLKKRESYGKLARLFQISLTTVGKIIDKKFRRMRGKGEWVLKNKCFIRLYFYVKFITSESNKPLEELVEVQRAKINSTQDDT